MNIPETNHEKRNFGAALQSMVASLPSHALANIGKALGYCVYLVDNRHRRIVRRNLRFIHPGWSESQVRTVSRKVFQNVGITFLEVIQMASFTREEILQKIRVRGKEHLLAAEKGPKGAIIISAHLGNWEMSQICGTCLLKTPLVLVARKVRPEFLNRWINRFRSRLGSVIVDKSGALPRMARTLRKGSIVGLLIDQSTLRTESVEIKFLGKYATATPAAAILARRFDAPVLPAFCVREADGGLTLQIEPPLNLKTTGDRQADILENTQIMNDAIGEAIRSYPDQWFWFHKRWKRYYPHLYPEDRARRKRQQAKKPDRHMQR